ncbi:unnamed protein product [Gordionus sp. m RMFG-2023]
MRHKTGKELSFSKFAVNNYANGGYHHSNPALNTPDNLQSDLATFKKFSAANNGLFGGKNDKIIMYNKCINPLYNGGFDNNFRINGVLKNVPNMYSKMTFDELRWNQAADLNENMNTQGCSKEEDNNKELANPKHLTNYQLITVILIWLSLWTCFILLKFTLLVLSVNTLPWILGLNVENPGSIVGGLWGYCLIGNKMNSYDEKPFCLSYANMSTINPSNMEFSNAYDIALQNTELDSYNYRDASPNSYRSPKMIMGLYLKYWFISFFQYTRGPIHPLLSAYIGAFVFVISLMVKFLHSHVNGINTKVNSDNINNVDEKNSLQKPTISKLKRIQIVIVKHLLLVVGWSLNITALLNLLSTLIYPLSWKDDIIRRVCGRNTKAYDLDGCVIGNGYYLAILCLFIEFSLATLAIFTARKVTELQIATKFKLSKRYLGRKSNWKLDEILNIDYEKYKLNSNQYLVGSDSRL